MTRDKCVYNEWVKLRTPQRERSQVFRKECAFPAPHVAPIHDSPKTTGNQPCVTVSLKFPLKNIPASITLNQNRSVTIGQCISICMGHRGGDRCFICYGPRDSRRTGGEPCGDTKRYSSLSRVLEWSRPIVCLLS